MEVGTSIEIQSLKTKACRLKPEEDQVNIDFGLWSSGFFGLFGLQVLVLGLQSLACRIGTPCYLVLNEYRSGHSILYYYESTHNSRTKHRRRGYATRALISFWPLSAELGIAMLKRMTWQPRARHGSSQFPTAAYSTFTQLFGKARGLT